MMGGLISYALSSGLGDEQKLTTITISKNGEYKPPTGFVGFEKVTVNVPTAEANIIPLTVTEPGTYNAADYGCDGFDPVNVSDMYKKLYEQSIGNGEDVTDDNGNNIPNAVTSDDTDDLNEYYKHVEFGPYGGSVTSQGLDGDTSFKFESWVTKTVWGNGETWQWSTSVKMTLTNLITGETQTFGPSGAVGAWATVANAPRPHRVKVTEVYFKSDAWVVVSAQILDWSTGGVLAGTYIDGYCGQVNGTTFRKTAEYASTSTQKTEPDEYVKY